MKNDDIPNQFELLNSNRHEQVLLVLAKQNIAMADWIEVLVSQFENNDEARRKTAKLRGMTEDLFQKLEEDYRILALEEKMNE